MRLIMGCQFQADDLEAIRQGYSLRETWGDRLWTLFSVENGDRRRVAFSPQVFRADLDLPLITWGDPPFSPLPRKG